MLEDVFRSVEQKMQKAVEITQKYMSAFRTGRATPALLDRVQVDYHGSQIPVKELATISVPEPRMMLIQPWDRSVIGAIEKAILKSALGLNPSSDGTVIRLVFPQLTEDRRRELVKGVHARTEEGKVAIRNIRRDGIEEIKKLEKDKQVSEDEAKRAQDNLQKLYQKYIAQVDEVARQKEREVMEV